MVSSTVVLLHGFGTSAPLWADVQARLGRLSVALDLPGFGGNTAGHSAHDYTVDGMADHVAQQVQAAGLTRYTLAGHSMGGKVAAVLAARQPVGLTGLLLLASSPPSPEPMTERGRAELKAAWGDPERLRALYAGIVRAPLPASSVLSLIEDGLRAEQAAWTAWPDHGSREHHERQMARVAVPVRVLASRSDPVMTPQVMRERVMPAFPGAALRELDGPGHLLPLEAPKEVAGWLDDAARDLTG
ncbi:alpha/beta hydrolase [Deinococcus sonorensis]|uniref:Alpha/beta hydrolase n=2 Tax=Deinococcus sonorensis TaxID=309891 RepID=A0AAU7UDX0_9DEIO